MPIYDWRLSKLKAHMDGSFSNENPLVFIATPDGEPHQIKDVQCVQGEAAGTGMIIIAIE